ARVGVGGQRDGRPRRAGVAGAVDPADTRVGGLGDGVEHVLITRRDGHLDPLEAGGRKAGVGRDLRPGALVAAVGGVDPVGREDAEGGIDAALGVDLNVGDTGRRAVARAEDHLPGFAAVLGTTETALSRRRVDVAGHRSDGYLLDVLKLGARRGLKLDPGLTAVHALKEPAATYGVNVEPSFPGAHVENLRVGRVVGDGGDGEVGPEVVYGVPGGVRLR